MKTFAAEASDRRFIGAADGREILLVRAKADPGAIEVIGKPLFETQPTI